VEGDDGFHGFAVRTFPEDATLFESTLRWDPRAGIALRGRNVVAVEESPEFTARALDHAAGVTRELLDRERLLPSDVDLLITSQHPPGFGDRLARRLGVPSDRVPEVSAELAGAHTAGPIAALEASIAGGRLARAHHTVIATVGAGITVGVVLYRAPRSSAA